MTKTKTKIKFTKSKIDEIKFSVKGLQVIYWDINTPGLGLVVVTTTAQMIALPMSNTCLKK